MEGELNPDEVHSIFTARQTTFGVTLHLTEHKGAARAGCGISRKSGVE